MGLTSSTEYLLQHHASNDAILYIILSIYCFFGVNIGIEGMLCLCITFSQFFEVFLTEIVSVATLILSDNGPIILLSRSVVSGSRMEPYAWSDLCLFQIFIHCFQNLIEVLFLIIVGHGFDLKVDLIVLLPVEVVEIIRFGNVILDLSAQHQACLICPTSCHVLYCVSSPSQQNHGCSKGFHEGEKFTVASDGHVEVTQFVPGERVSAALNDHDIWHVERADPAHDFLEKLDVGGIVHALLEGYVGSVKLADSFTDLIQCASAGEEIFLELVEADSEDTVGVVECLFDSISVVHVDVQIQDTRICFQQLQDAEHDVIDVAEATRL